MLQQTQVSRVLPKLEEWLSRWPTPADLAAADPSEAIRAWDRLGYPRRALWLHRAAVTITTEHNGVVPRDVPTLLSLTGVGDYTARAVAVFAYGDRHPVVDTNTRRVIARAVHGQAEAAAPNSRVDLADMAALLPQDRAAAATFNAAAMELGALVCTAQQPRCTVCPIRELCRWQLGEGTQPLRASPKRKQAAFAGSDRQARGAIMAALRASLSPVAPATLERVWAAPEQRARAINGLVRDALVTRLPDGSYQLAGSTPNEQAVRNRHEH